MTDWLLVAANSQHGQLNWVSACESVYGESSTKIFRLIGRHLYAIFEENSREKSCEKHLPTQNPTETWRLVLYHTLDRKAQTGCIRSDYVFGQKKITPSLTKFHSKIKKISKPAYCANANFIFLDKMSSEQFSLSWNEFHKNLSTGFTNLFEDSSLVDVTLAVEGKKIQAHKVVLSVCSPYFKELFHENPCQHPIVFLKDVNFTVLQNLLKFMYQGEVNVTQEELPEFIKTAEDLQIKGLTSGTNDAQQSSSPSRNRIKNERAETSPYYYGTRQVATRLATRYSKQSPVVTPLPVNTRKSASSSVPQPSGNKRPRFHLENSQEITRRADVSNMEVRHGDMNTNETQSNRINNSISNHDMIMQMKLEPEDRNDDDDGTNHVDEGYSYNHNNEYEDNPSTSGLQKGENVSQDDIYFIKSLRGTPMLVIGDFTFSRNKRTKTRTYWLCCRSETSKCKVSCIIQDDGMIRMPRGHIHNHPDDARKIKSSSIMNVSYNDISAIFANQSETIDKTSMDEMNLSQINSSP